MEWWGKGNVARREYNGTRYHHTEWCWRSRRCNRNRGRVRDRARVRFRYRGRVAALVMFLSGRCTSRYCCAEESCGEHSQAEQEAYCHRDSCKDASTFLHYEILSLNNNGL